MDFSHPGQRCGQMRSSVVTENSLCPGIPYARLKVAGCPSTFRSDEWHAIVLHLLRLPWCQDRVLGGFGHAIRPYHGSPGGCALAMPCCAVWQPLFPL